MEPAQSDTLAVPSEARTRRSRSPAAALLRRVKLGSSSVSRSLSGRRSHVEASSPEASGPDRAANCSSSDEEQNAGNSTLPYSDHSRSGGGGGGGGGGGTVFRSVRRQLKNKLLRSRHKKAVSEGGHSKPGAEQAVVQWLDKAEADKRDSGMAEERTLEATPTVVAVLEDEVDADIEFDEDEANSMKEPSLIDRPARLRVEEPPLGERSGVRKDAGTVWEVIIHLISGSQLVIRDSTGTSDPYVKFKYNAKVLERSKIVRRTLNPIWDEYFCFYVDDLNKPLEVRVYDYDKLCDDYMGRALIDLSSMELEQNSELTLELEDETGKSKEKFMGTVRLACRVIVSSLDSETASNVSSSRVPFSSVAAKPPSKRANLMLRGLRTAMDVSRRFKGPNWVATVTITLIEGQDLLPMDDNGTSDPFVKFRLGNEKYRSKIQRNSLNPRWLEQFDLRLGSEEVPRFDILEMTVWDHDDIGRNDFMGRASISLGNLERERTHLIEKALEDGAGTLRLLITISGSFEPDSVTDLRNYTVSDLDRQLLVTKFNIFRSFVNISEVGWLQVKVLKAEGLSPVAWSGKIDPFVVVELVNSRLQTQTEYKTNEPEWNKVFVFHVHDIHSMLEITVFDEERDKKPEMLGRVAIPLLRIRNGEKRWYALKDRKLLRKTKGAILLELDFIYNYVKAAWRTVNPKETKYAKPDPKFKLAVFRSHIDRISRIIDSCLIFGQFVESCFAWESPARSLAAFVSFMVAVWTFEPYMLPMTLALVFVKEYIHGALLAYLYRRSRVDDGRRIDDAANTSPTSRESGQSAFNNNTSRKTFSIEDGESFYPSTSDDEDKSDKPVQEDKRTTIKERIQTVQDTMLKVQEYMGSIAAFFERIHNTFTWTVPWLSLLAVICLIVATLILYFVPIRWLAMAWGINKFTKKLLRPHAIDNNELLDFLSRVPSDIQLLQYKELKPDLAGFADSKRR